MEINRERERTQVQTEYDEQCNGQYHVPVKRKKPETNRQSVERQRATADEQAGGEDTDDDEDGQENSEEDDGQDKDDNLLEAIQSWQLTDEIFDITTDGYLTIHRHDPP